MNSSTARSRAPRGFSARAPSTPTLALEYIAENLDAPTVVLQYPSKRELIRELKKGYDYVGVSFLLAVMHKMKETVALIRQYAPNSKIVLGGYGTVLEGRGLKPYGDYFCREEGVGLFPAAAGRTRNADALQAPADGELAEDIRLEGVWHGQNLRRPGLSQRLRFLLHLAFLLAQTHPAAARGQGYLRGRRALPRHEPELVFLIIDEDFLLNKKRAMEFRDCVMKSGRTLSIFAFSSIKAISQYTVEEILEMGIDGFWIGYEGTRSDYAKQQGRAVEDILTEFREHGITVLTSMIVGFDYQNREVVAQELEGLMELKPALAQFLIYGPVPGTPFYERIIKENLLQDVYTSDKDLFYRRADGFRTMIKHPTLSPEAIEDIQRWCFEQDFQRLGPSIFRVLEARLLGYQKLEEFAEPASCAPRPAYYARELRVAYPVFLAGRLMGPNARIRRWIGDVEQRIHAELGRPTRRAAQQVGDGRWRGAVDRAHLEAELVPAPQADAHDLSHAQRTMERVQSLGGNPRKVANPRTLRPGGTAARQTAGLDAPGRSPLLRRTPQGLAQRIPIPWPEAKAASSWT